MTSNHPAKKAAAKKATTGRDKPAAVALNFDTWARPEAVDPYPIVIGGERYESLDPMDVDYRELEKVLNGDVEEVFKLLFPDDYEAILENKISVGALVRFNEDVVTHFGLEDFVAAQS